MALPGENPAYDARVARTAKLMANRNIEQHQKNQTDEAQPDSAAIPSHSDEKIETEAQISRAAEPKTDVDEDAKKKEDKLLEPDSKITDSVFGMIVGVLFATALIPSVRELFFSGSIRDFLLEAGSSAAFAFIAACITWIVIMLASHFVKKIKSEMTRWFVYACMLIPFYLGFLLLCEKWS